VAALVMFVFYQSKVAPVMRYDPPAQYQFLAVYVVLGGVYAAVLGVLELVYASKLLADPIRVSKPARYIAIMEIAGIAVSNWLTLITGIVALNTYSKSEVVAFFRIIDRSAALPTPSSGPLGAARPTGNCRSCGAALSQGDKFCPDCGSAVL
jgi:hypothetical protein